MRTSFVREESYSVGKKRKEQTMSCVGIWFILCFKVFGELYIEVDACVVRVSGTWFPKSAKKNKKQGKNRSNVYIVPRFWFLNTILHKMETTRKCLNPKMWLKNKIILEYPNESENKKYSARLKQIMKMGQSKRNQLEKA